MAQPLPAQPLVFPEQAQLFKTRIEAYLKQQLSSYPMADEKLKSAMEYSLLLGGKRVRPFLVYATGQLFSLPQQDLDPLAGAIEAIHSYSLIHDDLPAMDDDDLRRGKATCHKQFDEATAILAGDSLQSLAFYLLTNHNYQQVLPAQLIGVIQQISHGALAMCSGQSIDLQNTDKQVSLTDLEAMHQQKTGALIEASVIMPAVAAGANAKEVKWLTQYAQAIGLAFQVWDDVLDITSDTQTLGKPQGSDLAANKSTYPALLGLQQAQSKAQNLIEQALHALEQLPYNTELLEQLAHYIIQRDH